MSWTEYLISLGNDLSAIANAWVPFVNNVMVFLLLTLLSVVLVVVIVDARRQH